MEKEKKIFKFVLECVRCGACRVIYAHRIMGAGPLVLGPDPLVPRIMWENYQVARRLKEVLDPSNIMTPGIAFLA